MDCDVERKKLLEDMDEIAKIDDSELDADEKAAMGKRLSQISTRLEDIDA